MNRREFVKAGSTLAMAPAVLTRAQSPQVIDRAGQVCTGRGQTGRRRINEDWLKLHAAKGEPYWA